MRIGSLFSGAGGLDMAVEQVFGGHTVWHCENDPAASKVLPHRWPGQPNLGDITKVDWAGVEPIDVLCGGWPCQPWSAAGKQLGVADERALWPEVARAVRALRPRYVVLENVPTVIVFGELARAVGDLAAIGYDTQWCCLRAFDVGAPHRRERLFLLATDSRGDRCCCGAQCDSEPVGPELEVSQLRNTHRRSRDAAGARPVNLLPTPTTQDGANCAGPSQFDRNSLPLNVVATLLPTPTASDGSGGRSPSHSGGVWTSGTKRSVPLTGMPHLLPTPSASDDAGGKTSRSGNRIDEPLLGGIARDFAGKWGKYEPAIRRWEHLTRPAPAPTEPNRNGNSRLSPAFSEWIMGWPQGWVTAVPGISRNDQLRIIGNGVCPQQCAAALCWLLSIAAT